MGPMAHNPSYTDDGDSDIILREFFLIERRMMECSSAHLSVTKRQAGEGFVLFRDTSP